jgi:BlaI family transcriptional regulator, penicillinase repressor
MAVSRERFESIDNAMRRAMIARLGRVQLKIMRVLWDRHRATAKEITDALNEHEPVAHSTVQTLLRSLEAKRAVGHHVDGRTFIFFPVLNERQLAQGGTRELMDRLFGGSVGSLVCHLLKHEKLTAEELNEIQRLINEQAQK